MLTVKVLHTHQGIRARCVVGDFLTEKLLQFAVGNCWLRDAEDHELPITIDRATLKGFHCSSELLLLTLIVLLGLNTLAARSSLRTVGCCWGNHDLAEFEASRALILCFTRGCDTYGLRLPASSVLTRVFSNIHN